VTGHRDQKGPRGGNFHVSKSGRKVYHSPLAGAGEGGLDVLALEAGAGIQNQINAIGVANIEMPRGGMKPASLESVRGAFAGLDANEATQVALGTRDVAKPGASGAKRLLPVEITVYDGEEDRPKFQDGRHRLQAAREAGATQIAARVQRMTEEGDLLPLYEGPLSINGT
jgi:hypothetical protein